MSSFRPPFLQPRRNLSATMKRNAARRECPSCHRKNALVTNIEGATVCKWNGTILDSGNKACDYYVPPKGWDA